MVLGDISHSKTHNSQLALWGCKHVCLPFDFYGPFEFVVFTETQLAVASTGSGISHKPRGGGDGPKLSTLGKLTIFSKIFSRFYLQLRWWATSRTRKWTEIQSRRKILSNIRCNEMKFRRPTRASGTTWHRVSVARWLVLGVLFDVWKMKYFFLGRKRTKIKTTGDLNITKI